MDSNQIKAVVDLREYLATLGHGRPPLGAILKKLGIDPKVMSDTVTSTTMAATVAIPEFAIHIVNDLFKLGVTIGYKYAVTKQMDETFGEKEGEEDEQPDQGE